MEKGPRTSVIGRDLAILLLAMVVSRVGFGVIIIIFPSYIMRSSDISAAAALALYPLLEAVSSIPMGRLCDTRGRKLIFASSLGYLAVLMVFIGLTRNIYVVSFIHALMGIGAAGVTVASLTMITDLTKVNNRGKGMGAFDFANIGGYALGLLIGGRLDVAFASRLGLAFFVTGSAIAVAFVVALAILKEPFHVSREGKKNNLNPLKALDSRAKAILPIWLSITTLIGIVLFLPRALRSVLPAGTTANLLFVGVVALGLGSIGFGALSDRIGRPKVLVIGVVGLMGLLSTVSIAFPGGIKALETYFPLIGICAIATSALVPSILATVGDSARTGARGIAMGLYSVMLSGGMAVGTLIAGVAHQTGGLTGIFSAGTVIFAAASLVSLVLWVNARNAGSAQQDQQQSKIVSDGGPESNAGVAQPGQRRGA